MIFDNSNMALAISKSFLFCKLFRMIKFFFIILLLTATARRSLLNTNKIFSNVELFFCPQGSCLSPILYNLYTSDFPQLNYCTLSIFADDTAVLSSELLACDVIGNLQRALNELHCYFKKWRIELS